MEPLEIIKRQAAYVSGYENIPQEAQKRAKQLCWEYNRTSPEEGEKRREILQQLLGTCSPMTGIEPDFHCDYGFNIHTHGLAVINYNCVILDSMYNRGIKLVRYADDIVVLAKSKRAAERLVESCHKYLEGRLKLKMNTEKSKVTSIFAQKNFKFLGFCLGRNGSGVYIRTHRKALRKAKEKLKLLTKRNRGRNVRRVMQEVKMFIRGWIGYFRVADMKRTLMAWDEWLRRRLRMYIWKQWKKPRTKVANLRKLGIPADKACQWGNSRLGYWRIAGSPVLECSITNKRLAIAGYFSILTYYESLHLCD